MVSCAFIELAQQHIIRQAIIIEVLMSNYFKCDQCYELILRNKIRTQTSLIQMDNCKGVGVIGRD